MYEVIAPNLGQSNSDITIEQWFKAEGDHIDAEEELYEMSNMKLNQEVTVPVSGTVVKLYFEEGDEVAPGTKIADIEED